MISTIFLSIPKLLREIGFVMHFVSQWILWKTLQLTQLLRAFNPCLCFLKCYALHSNIGLNFFFINYFPGIHCPVYVPPWRLLLTFFFFPGTKILTFSEKQIISKITILMSSPWTKSLIEPPPTQLNNDNKNIHSNYYDLTLPYCLLVSWASLNMPYLLRGAIYKILERKISSSCKGQILIKEHMIIMKICHCLELMVYKADWFH